MHAIPSTLGLRIEVGPADEGNKAERRLRARRIRWYPQHGAHLVECAANDRAPLADRDGPLRMTLPGLPPVASARVPIGVALSEWIVNIYTHGYELPCEHPLIGAILKGVI